MNLQLFNSLNLDNTIKSLVVITKHKTYPDVNNVLTYSLYIVSVLFVEMAAKTLPYTMHK